jgi:hypothetical protein
VIPAALASRIRFPTGTPAFQLDRLRSSQKNQLLTPMEPKWTRMEPENCFRNIEIFPVQTQIEPETTVAAVMVEHRK